MPNNTVIILFIGLHRPNRSPSQRYRFEQYIPYFNSKGFKVEQLYLLGEKADTFYYHSNNLLVKTYILIKAICKLLMYLFLKKYDIVFVQREAFMLGTSFFEKQFAKKSKLIFDFDDSIWMHQTGEIKSKNEKFYFLKNYNKTSKIIKASHLCVVGNSFLATYARAFNNNVTIIPTAIDTESYSKSIKDNSPDVKICIGWTGSFSTIIHFQLIESCLVALKKKYNDKIYFKLIGVPSYKNENVDIKVVDWSPETEVKDLSELDIGIMPLPDDKWSKGKCGCKALQYMALGIPCVASSVGVNSEIIKDGEDGLLVFNEEDWVAKLSLLVEDEELRTRLGKKAKKRVEETYSVNANREKYITAFKRVLTL